KGISDLTLAECSVLVAAFSDTSKDRLRFELVPEMKGTLSVFVRNHLQCLLKRVLCLTADLMASRVPVIEGTAPEHDSPHPRTKRMFCNLKIDHKGLPRKSNPAATRVKKQ
ncbi:hypothetical protein HYDPIDRAFT_70802, partial [Hydnomerulius pinastri MD-312]